MRMTVGNFIAEMANDVPTPAISSPPLSDR